MSEEIIEELTGLCPFLTQDNDFESGQYIALIFVFDPSQREEICDWLPIEVVSESEGYDQLPPGHRNWNEETILVSATLAATGGQPLDTMNRPAGPFDPDAKTLSSVRILDHSSSEDAATPDCDAL